MTIKSPWITSTLVLIPGLLFILVMLLSQNYESGRAKSVDFTFVCLAISLLLTVALIALICKHHDGKGSLIMIFYLIGSAIMCFTFLYHYYDSLDGQMIFLYGLHNILSVIFLIVLLMHS